MQRLRNCIYLGLVAWGNVALLPGNARAQAGSIKIVAPGIWFREGDNSHGLCNNIIIEMKDYMVVVDANYPSGAAAVMRDIKYISPKPVKFVLDTHHHGDHSYGNSLWTQAGATTVAFQAMAEDLKRLGTARWLDAAKTREDVASLHQDAPEQPKQVVTEEIYVLNDGERRVEFRHFGWGHTRGDGYVYLPKEQVIATGDTVVNGPFNNLRDANIANWPDVLSKVDKLKIKFVLPGHGPMGSRDMLLGQQQFLRELYQAVKKGMDKGETAEEIQAGLKLPSGVSNWVSEATLKQQTADVYQEIKAGKPRGEL